MRFLIKKTPDNFIRTVNDEISSLLNRHFDSYFPEAAYWEEMDKFSMPVEIEDKGKEFIVKAEIPGIKKEDLDIDIDKNCICINAKKKKIKRKKMKNIHTKNPNSDTESFQEPYISPKKLIRNKQKQNLKTVFLKLLFLNAHRKKILRKN